MNCNVITKYYSLIVTNADLSRQLYANDDVKFFGSDKYIPLHVIQQREMEGKGNIPIIESRALLRLQILH